MQVGYKTDKCIQTDCPYSTEPMTNADRIRAMSDEELAEYIGQHTLCDRIQDEGDWCDKRAVCRDCLTDWLRQPVKGEP